MTDPLMEIAKRVPVILLSVVMAWLCIVSAISLGRRPPGARVH